MKFDIRGIFKEDKRYSYFQIFFASCAVILTSGIFLNDYFIKLGFTEMHLGIFGAVVNLLSLASLPISFMANKTTHKRRFFMTFGAMSFCLLPVMAAIPYVFAGQSELIIWSTLIIMALSVTLLFIAYIVLFPWLHSIVSGDRWPRYFSLRQLIGYAPGLIITPIFGALLTGAGIRISTGLFIFAFVLGMIQVGIVRFVPDYKISGDALAAEPALKERKRDIVKGILRDRPFMRIVTYSTMMGFGLGVLTPVIYKYLITEVHVTSPVLSRYQTLMALMSVFGFLFLGRICEAKGNYFILRATGLLACAIPALLFIIPNSPYILTAIMFTAGISEGAGLVMSAIFMSLVGIMLNTAPERNKIIYMQFGTFMKYAVISLAAILSGWVTKNITGVNILGRSFTGYELMFVVSFMAMAASYILILFSKKLLVEQPWH